MADNEPSFFEYVKEAFFARKRVPGMGGVPLNVLALLAIGVASIASPGLLLVGAGLEVGYLAWLSQNERFRNLVRGSKRLEQQLSFAERLKRIVAQLSPEGNKRFEKLADKCERIRELGQSLGALPADVFDEMKESGLNSLLLIYARLLLSRESLVGYMRDSNRRDLEGRLQDASGRLAAATTDAIKRSLEGNIEILRKRLAHHDSARQNLLVIDSEIERIENQVDLIREELAVSRDPAAFSARIDAVAGTLGEANQFLIANEALFGTLSPEAATEAGAIPAPRAREKA